MIKKYRKFQEIQDNYGTIAATKSTADYLVPFYEYDPIYQQSRVDTNQRYELINSRLDECDNSMLDVGCAEGILLSKFADDGLFCIGLEQNDSAVKHAQKEYRYTDDLGVIRSMVTPERIEKLPEFDVVLLLTVYQHLISTKYSEGGFGVDGAEDILKSLASKSDKIFFEIWEDSHDISKMFDMSRFPFDTDNMPPKEFWENYFKFVLGDEISVDYIGETEYRGKGRKDILFLIRCSSY